MLLKDVDSRLDTECKLVFSKEDRVFSLSKAMNRTFLGFFDVKENVLTVYIPRLGSEPASMALGFRVSTDEMEGYVLARVQIEDSIVGLISSLGNIASASTPTVSVERGRLTVHFRLHHSSLPQLSSVLAQTETFTHLLKEVNIFPSEGFSALLNRANDESPLYVLDFELPLSIWKNEAVISALREGGIGELSSCVCHSTAPKVIVYGTGAVSTGLTPVSPDSFVYETAMDSEVLVTMNALLNVQGIHRYDVFFRIVNDKFRVTIFVDKNDEVRYLNEVFNFYSRAGVQVSLMLSQKFSDEIWKTL